MSAKDETRRIIGIRHRVKQTTQGEARPTIVAIRKGSDTRTLELETETKELDFLLSRFPTKHRKATDDDDISGFRPHQCKFKKLGTGETAPENHLLRVGKETWVLTQVPAEFEGLRAGDSVVMLFGGSGDRFAYALSNRGEEVSASVYRIPAFRFRDFRPEGEKDGTENDHIVLTEVFTAVPALFQKVEAWDRDIIRVRLAFEARQDAMKARIACGNRLHTRLVGKIFLNPEGHYPEGVLEDIFDEAKANDITHQALVSEETRCSKELEGAVQKLQIWTRFFEPLESVGPAIAGGLISAIGDIRRFATEAKLKRYLGVHVCSGGEFGNDIPVEKQFPRRRQGQVANWNSAGRQALYLLADQWNRRPESVWGQKLRANKTRLRARHPEVEIVNGKKRYTDIHIHKMAVWRTISQFVEALHVAWWQIEKEAAKR